MDLVILIVPAFIFYGVCVKRSSDHIGNLSYSSHEMISLGSISYILHEMISFLFLLANPARVTGK